MEIVLVPIEFIPGTFSLVQSVPHGELTSYCLADPTAYSLRLLQPTNNTQTNPFASTLTAYVQTVLNPAVKSVSFQLPTNDNDPLK